MSALRGGGVDGAADLRRLWADQVTPGEPEDTGEVYEVRVFGSDEVQYVFDTGPSIASAALAKARALFLADRIDAAEFERRVERALEIEGA